ncbi:MAG TPA: hypothetical protein VFR95_00305 [Gemmatimonadaceae bacterium]|nr:hypothetical protein [Gemmatimonadaceae bacterium]
MKKVLVLLAIGVALGYTWGWRDAHVNDRDVVTRIVSQVGGSTRGNLKNNPDHMLDSLSR